MKVVIRVRPFRFRPVHSLFGIRDIRCCAFDHGLPVEQIRLGTLVTGFRHEHGALLRGNRSAVVRDLPFQCSLLGLRSLECVTKGPVVDLEKKLSLFHELIVPDTQPRDRAFHLRSNSDEIGENFRVIRARLAIRFEKHNQTQSNRSRYDCDAKRANCFGAVVLRLIRFHRASSAEKKEPKSKCEQGRQAGIHHDRRRERFTQVNRQQQETSSRRQQNSQGQANEPSREKGSQDVERWSLLTARKRKHAKQKQRSRGGAFCRLFHGWSLEPLIRIRSPVRKARSATASRTCVRAATSAVRACASARCAAVTSSKLRTP